MATKSKIITSMDEFAKLNMDRLVPFKAGDVVSASIVSVSTNSIVVDIEGITLGIIPNKEFSYDIDDLNPGDKIMAYVMYTENDDGMAVLSMKRADRERVWTTLTDKYTSKETLKVKISAANRGGLMAEFGGVEGFVPVSQLSPIHYPKVDGGDQSKILSKLKELVKSTLEVRVITVDKATQKLIFSEKAVGDEKTAQIANSYKKGEVLDGKVTAVVDFGIFVSIASEGKEKIEGLVHVSEISWERVTDLEKKYKVGDDIKVKVIGVQDGKVSLSVKQLLDDPWEKEAEKIKVGTKMKGQVARITPFGAFVNLENGLDGLAHISELGEKVDDPKKVVEEGKEYSFTVVSVEPKTRKISLSLKPAKKVVEKSEETKKSKTKKPAVKAEDSSKKTVKTKKKA